MPDEVGIHINPDDDLNPDDLHPDDIQRGRTALTQLQPRLPSAPVGRSQGLALSRAAVAMLALPRRVRDRGWRPRFEALPAAEWSVAHLDQLEAGALALIVLLIELRTASASEPTVRVPLELVRRSHRHRARLLHNLEFVLADNSDAMTELGAIRRGSGHTDLMTDLTRLAALVRTHEATLADELPRRHRANDAAEADRLASEILSAITTGTAPRVQQLRQQADQLFGLAERDYDEVRRAGTFLFWGRPEQALFPTVRAAAL